MIFVDTSAIYAWTDAADDRHAAAVAALAELLERAEPLVSHNYVLVEALTLVHHRLGRSASAALDDDFRALRVEWVDAALHEEAIDGWTRRSSRAMSLVDQVSFVLMRRLQLNTAFAFDRDFETKASRCIHRHYMVVAVASHRRSSQPTADAGGGERFARRA